MKLDFLFFKNKKPETSLLWGYLSYIIIGLLLLSIPWFRMSDISIIDNLFTAVSAISTTGLTTISVVDNYTILGQIVILVLIQIGGIGYMSFGSFIVLSTSQNLPENRENVHKTAFSLPKDFNIKKFIKSIVIYTFLIEAVGAVLFLFSLWDDPRVNPVWSSIFHSISAFCTAGFSLYNDSFMSYTGNIYLNTVVSILSFLGAIGYIVMVDLWLLFKKKKNKITFTSKIILVTTFILFFLGGFLIFLESVLKTNFSSNTLLQSFFQSMTALTTVGFNTVSIGDLSSFSLFIILILMIIGASPSGTGGGVKTTTITSIIGTIKTVFSSNKEFINYKQSNKIEEFEDEKNHLITKITHFFHKIRGKDSSEKNDFHKLEEKEKNDTNVKLEKTLGDIFKIKIMNKTIPFDRIVHAFATFAFYFIILSFGILLLLTMDQFSFQQLFFEAASALGTVGLSTGITGAMTPFGKTVIIILMFIGRLGPITFGIVLFSRKRKKQSLEKYEDIVI